MICKNRQRPLWVVSGPSRLYHPNGRFGSKADIILAPDHPAWFRPGHKYGPPGSLT